jgi:hypothetical protein
MWRVYRAANRPWPVLSPDPVIDYMIMEAVAIKAKHEEDTAVEEQKREDFKKDFSSLEHLR